MPSSGLSPLVRFVPFFPFGRSFLPPLSVITSHALSASFVVAIFLFRPYLIAPLRFAFFKVEKSNRPLFFQRWLFLHSVRSIVRLRLILLFFLAISQLVRQAWLSMLLHYCCSALSSFLVRRSRPSASFRLPPTRSAKFPRTSSLACSGFYALHSKPLQKKHRLRSASPLLFWRCFFFIIEID